MCDVVDRWSQVIGSKATPSSIAQMVGVSFSQVYRWASSNAWPEHPMLILHTLERVPRRYWPGYLKERLEFVRSKR